MNTRRVAVMAFTALAIAAPTAAQEQASLELTQYSPDQRWQRAARQFTVSPVAMIARAREKGGSPEDLGRWLADFFSQSWSEPGSGSPDGFTRGHNRNIQLWPGGEIEVVSRNDRSITARYNRPWVEMFGEDGRILGITIDEYETVFETFFLSLADYMGLMYEQRRAGDWIVFTVSEAAAS